MSTEDMQTSPVKTPAGAASSAHRRAHMARSSVVVMAAFVVSKIVGLLRDRAIAHAFGATGELDAYFAAFKIPDLLFTLVAGGALISAFVPVFSDALARDDEAEAWRVASTVTNFVFVTTVVLAAVSAYFAEPLVARVIAPGFGPGQQALTADLMRWILLSTLVFALSGIQMGILNAFQHFLMPALAPIVYNLGILAGALALSPRFGIRGLALGVILGAFGHLLIKLPALRRHGFRWWPLLSLREPGLRQILGLMWPRVLGLGTVQAVFIVSTNLASSLDAGSLSAFQYAWVIAQMPQTILGTAIATVAFPTLAELASRGDRDGLRDIAVSALEIMIALSLPAAVGLALLGRPAIAMLLQTGRFDALAAEATLLALQMFALGLVGHVAFEIVARLFYAQKDTLTVLYIAALAMVVNIALAFRLVGPLAQGGLALANSVAVSLEVVVGLWILHRRLGGIGIRRLLDTLLRSGAASLVMGLTVWAVLAWSRSSAMVGGLDSPLIRGTSLTLLGATTGLISYGLAARLLRLTPLAWLIGAIRRRRGARR